MAKKEKVETRQFRIHSNIINHLIEAQGADEYTSINELVQNSFDAGAHSVTIDITWPKFAIHDSGKGFSDESEIQDFFETFGTPHQEDYTERKTFGRFRIGRSQIFGLAKTVWRSGEFEMTVDFKKAGGLSYELKKGLPLAVGCDITGEFYEDKIFSPDPRYVYNLIDRFKFYPFDKPITINGTVSNEKPDPKEIIFENENFIVVKNDLYESGTRMFNMGAFICALPISYLGFEGNVISKVNLPLDISRSKINPADSRWQALKRQLDSLKPDISKLQRKKLTEDERILVISEFRKNSIEPEVFYESFKIFVDYFDSKHYTVEQLFRLSYEKSGIVFLKFDPKNALADYIINTYDNYVFLRTFDSNQRKFKQLLDDVLLRFQESDSIYDAIVEFDSLKSLYNPDYRHLKDSELNPVEISALSGVRSAIKENKYSLKKLESKLSCSITGRGFFAGESLVADGWTDGQEMVFVNRRLLTNLKEGYKSAEYLATVLIHEFAHDGEDTNNHTYEFYKRFHDLILSERTSGLLRNLSMSILENFYKEMAKRRLPVGIKVFSEIKMDKLAFDDAREAFCPRDQNKLIDEFCDLFEAKFPLGVPHKWKLKRNVSNSRFDRLVYEFEITYETILTYQQQASFTLKFTSSKQEEATWQVLLNVKTNRNDLSFNSVNVRSKGWSTRNRVTDADIKIPLYSGTSALKICQMIFDFYANEQNAVKTSADLVYELRALESRVVEGVIMSNFRNLDNRYIVVDDIIKNRDALTLEEIMILLNFAEFSRYEFVDTSVVVGGGSKFRKILKKLIDEHNCVIEQIQSRRNTLGHF